MEQIGLKQEQQQQWLLKKKKNLILEIARSGEWYKCLLSSVNCLFKKFISEVLTGGF